MIYKLYLFYSHNLTFPMDGLHTTRCSISVPGILHLTCRTVKIFYMGKETSVSRPGYGCSRTVKQLHPGRENSLSGTVNKKRIGYYRRYQKLSVKSVSSAVE